MHQGIGIHLQVGRCYAVLQLRRNALGFDGSGHGELGLGYGEICTLRLLLFGATLEEGAGVYYLECRWTESNQLIKLYK